MRFLSIFSGIEAASVAWKSLGWQCVGVAEIEPFPCAVLAHHYPDVPNLGSVTDITDEQIAALGPIDVVVGGSPCQDLSVAGKRAGLAGERSGLFHKQLRIFHAARHLCGARFLVWENVPGAFSSNAGRDFAVVVGAMAGCHVDVPANKWGTEGVALGEHGLVEWAVLDAQWFGVAQRRRRVFAVLDTGDWAGRPPILLEPDSLRGDSAPSREARKDTSGSTGDGVARCITTGEAKRQDWETYNFVAGVAPTLQAGGNSTGGDRPPGTTVPAIAFDTTQITSKANYSNPQPGDPCHPLAAGAHAPAVAFSRKDHGADAGEIAPTLRSMGHDASHANGGGQVAVAFAHQAGGTQTTLGYDPELGTAPTLSANQTPAVITYGEIKHAGAQETDATSALRALRKAVGAKAFAEWGLGILDSLQPSEILRQAVHGCGIRLPAFSRSWVVCCALGSPFSSAEGAVQSLREAGCAGRSPQGREPPEQLARELGAYLSELSQPGAQAERFMRDLWRAAEGSGVLRQALSAVQDARRSSSHQAQPAHTLAVRRLTATECEFLQGFPRNYLDITYRGKPAADGNKYKALGNSMAVPVMRWIGQQIAAAASSRISA